MTDEPVNAPAAFMVVEEARRMFVGQQATLDSLRTRAIAMLSVGALVAGLFGSQLPKNQSDYSVGAVVVALVAFGISVALAATIVSPRRFNFDHGLSAPLRDFKDGEPVRSYDLAVSWARGYEKDRSENEDKLRSLMTCFQVVCALIGVQVVAWGLATVL